MQQPAQIGGELLRLRAGQQHAEIERMQEPRFVDPLFLVDHDAMHQGDLSGRAAEIDAVDLQPDLERLGDAWLWRGPMSGSHVTQPSRASYGVPRRRSAAKRTRHRKP